MLDTRKLPSCFVAPLLLTTSAKCSMKLAAFFPDKFACGALEHKHQRILMAYLLSYYCTISNSRVLVFGTLGKQGLLGEVRVVTLPYAVIYVVGLFLLKPLQDVPNSEFSFISLDSKPNLRFHPSGPNCRVVSFSAYVQTIAAAAVLLASTSHVLLQAHTYMRAYIQACIHTYVYTHTHMYIRTYACRSAQEWKITANEREQRKK